MRNKILTFLVLICISNHLSAQIPNSLSLDDKIYGLSKFWSEVNYNFVYMYKVDQQQWNNAYRESIVNVQKTQNDYEYFRELQKLCAYLKDGHTQVYLPEAIQNQIMITNFGAYRLFLTQLDGKIYVYDVNKSMVKEIPVGSEILKVNGLPVVDYQQKYVKPYISSSTEADLINKAAFNLLAGLEGEQYEIELKTPKGAIRNFKLTHSKRKKKN